MKKLKPLNILDNKGFWPEKAAIADALKELFSIGQCKVTIPIRDFGRYRSPGWRDKDNKLVPWQSVDWYVYDALDEKRLQVDSSRILHSLSVEPHREESGLGDHYDLFVMEEDMYDPGPGGVAEAGVLYRVGRSRALTAAVVSTHRIEHIWGLPYSYVKTEIMRQLCFMFGVPDPDREDLVLMEGEEAFCRNTCIMRPAHVAPQDWETLTADRLKRGPLCEACLEDLKAFFAAAAQEAQ